ncbi:MAG TPA: 2-dehydropantoate 2-reductase N-terminal domain-containing protein [Solirubrobacterales bacterium]
MSEKSIAVVGTGANGATLAADMAIAGLDVTCIEQWPAHVEAIKAEGVRIDSPQGPGERVPLRIFHLCEVATLRQRFDLIYVVVKAYDTRWACELVKPLLAPDGLAVGIQNGMTLDETASVFGPERTLAAVIENSANMFEPGIVERQTPRSQSWFALGSFHPSTVGREEELAEPLRCVGTVEVTDDIRSAKWMKLVANAAEMLPSAIVGLPLVEALAIDGMREVMEAAGNEALAAALASGRKIAPIFGQEGIERLEPEAYTRALLDAVANTFSLEDTRVTILQDWMKGRRGEGEQMNGLVVSELAKAGETAPVAERLLKLARQVEYGELEPTPANAELLIGCGLV